MTTTKNKGFLKTWKDDRGFGFIKPADGSEDVFIHISGLEGSVRRPSRGDTIFYNVEHGPDGKSKAVDAYIEGVEQFSGKRKWLWLIVAILVLAGIAGGVVSLTDITTGIAFLE